jgi:hypothetical protein
VPTLTTFAPERRSQAMAAYLPLPEGTLADAHPIERRVCDFLGNGT